MGDVLALIERAEAAFDAQQAMRMAEKIQKAEFDLEDFLEQLRQVRKMGPVAQILEMMPGMGKLAGAVDPQEAERQLKRIEAIILSMTPEERRNPRILNASRKRRIARGSGTTVQEVNALLNQYRQMQRLLQQLGKKRGFLGLGRLFGGF